MFGPVAVTARRVTVFWPATSETGTSTVDQTVQPSTVPPGEVGGKDCALTIVPLTSSCSGRSAVAPLA